MNNTIRVGITAVGSGIGQSIVHSCRLSSLPLHVVGYDASALAYGAYDCHEHHRVPSTHLPDYPAQLLQRCLADRLDLLIPGLDLDLPVLAEHAPLFEEQGIRVLVGGLDFIRLSRDKRVWGRTLNEYSAHILAGFTPAEAREAIRASLIHPPLIAKPGGGSASAGVRIIKTEDDLTTVADDFVVQPYAMPCTDDPSLPIIHAALEQDRLVQVAEISYQWLVSQEGEILGRMATRNRLKDGVPIEIIPIDDAPYWEVLSPLIPFLQAKGMRGPVNFQGRMTPDGPRFFEMNGRFTGITGLRAMFGFNEVDAAIRSFLGKPVDSSKLIINARRVGLRQVAERVVSLLSKMSRASRGTSIRLGRLYGALDGLRPDELPHKFARLAVQGNDIRIQGGGQEFDLIHVHDAVQALLSLLNARADNWNPAYNVSGGSPVNIIQIAEQAMDAARRLGLSVGRIDVSHSDDPPMQYGLNCAAFIALTGWQPCVTIRDGMEGLVRWMAEGERQGNESRTLQDK